MARSGNGGSATLRFLVSAPALTLISVWHPSFLARLVAHLLESCFRYASFAQRGAEGVLARSAGDGVEKGACPWGASVGPRTLAGWGGGYAPMVCDGAVPVRGPRSRLTARPRPSRADAARIPTPEPP